VRLADAFLDEIERKFSPSLIATDRVVGRATSGGTHFLRSVSTVRILSAFSARAP
jgi:hypothetical protein